MCCCSNNIDATHSLSHRELFEPTIWCFKFSMRMFIIRFFRMFIEMFSVLLYYNTNWRHSLLVTVSRFHYFKTDSIFSVARTWRIFAGIEVEALYFLILSWYECKVLATTWTVKHFYSRHERSSISVLMSKAKQSFTH